MADNNRNRDYQGSSQYNQDWNQNRGRYDRDEDYDQNRIENTQYGQGGYSNSNQRQNMGNYNQDRDAGYMGSNRGSYDRNYEGRNIEDRGNYGDLRNTSYGSVYGGNVERREEETNRAQGGRYSQMAGGNRGNYNRDYDRDYGYSAMYGSAGSYGADYNRGREQDFEGYGYNRERNREDRNWMDRAKSEVSSWFDNDDDNRGRGAQRMSGPHRGKGPKGYSRSDERILEDVSDRLSDDDALDASDIEVKVQGSEVILDGRVENKEAKRRAEDLAERISGVTNVRNNLKVSPIVGTRTTNAVISAVAEHNNPTYANQIDTERNRKSE